MITFTYLCSFLFTSHSTAQNVMIVVYLVGGIVIGPLLSVMSLVPDTESFTKHVLRNLIRFVPTYALNDIIFELSMLPLMDCQAADGTSINDCDKWSLKNSGTSLLFLYLSAPLYFGLVLLIEYLASFGNLLRNDPPLQLRPGEVLEAEDEDVCAERMRLQQTALPLEQTKFLALTEAIETQGAQDAVAALAASRDVEHGGAGSVDLVRLEGLRKIYPGKNAVKDVYFGIPAGQCFGFLGVNGAGKTTTVRLATAGSGKKRVGSMCLLCAVCVCPIAAENADG